MKGVKKVKEKSTQYLKYYIRIEEFMQMGKREEILEQLHKILEKNSNDARIYYRLAENCNRSFLTNFFKKLSYQKRIFCKRIRYEIKELEKEIKILEENPTATFKNPSSPALQVVPTLRNELYDLIPYCYKKEQQYVELYKNLLSKTHLGSIREMLLYQKHMVQLVLNEMKNFDSQIQNGKNEEEINYN